MNIAFDIHAGNALPEDPTLRQRVAARPDVCAWVAASAGSGKTKVLTDRVLNLLIAGSEPTRLLCLTFTRAAAAEMSIRIRRELVRWATAEEPALHSSLADLLGHEPGAEQVARARTLFATVLEAPGGLKIQTIHAFCQAVLARFPLEAGLAPGFEVLEERAQAEAMAEVRERLINRVRAEDPGHPLRRALDTVSSQAADLTFTTLMNELLRERERLGALWQAHGDHDGATGEIARRLGVAAGLTAEALLKTACAEGAFAGEDLRRICRALEAGGKTDQERLGKLVPWLAADEGTRVAGFEIYCSAFLTSAGSAAQRLATKAVLKAAPDAMDVLVREQERIIAVRRQLAAVGAMEATEALLRLASALFDEYEREKERRGRLDYDDLIRRAAHLLHDPGAAWVLYKLDEGIDHILIDEAQDTNPEQWRIVQALVEEFFAGEGAREMEVPRSLFVVGDRKQSIFGFQRADPAMFRAMQMRFREQARHVERDWRDVPLDTSFRSLPVVLRAVDAVFAGAAADGVVLPDDPPLHHRPHRDGPGRVEIWPVCEPLLTEDAAEWTPPTRYERELTPYERLAEVLAARIARWIREGEMLPARGRPVRAGDIMVLVRRRDAFMDSFVQALQRENVPVAGADRLELLETLAVQDLMALGDVLLLPEDDLTLAAVLKSPLVGLEEEELLDLAAGRGKERLWTRLACRAAEGGVFARAYDRISRLMARADFVRPYELYAELLGVMGGRHDLVARLGAEANDAIDEFLALTLAYEAAETPSLQGFLHWLRAGESTVKRELEHGARDEVRIMTVHGAKGLQAPIVILPDTTKPGGGRAGSLFWVPDAEDGEAPAVPVWSPGGARAEAIIAASEAKKAREAEEERRLLYVAMTRAEDRLYVCGWTARKSAPEECWHGLVTTGLARIATARPMEFDLPQGQGWSGEGLVLEGLGERVAAQAAAEAPARPAPPPEWLNRPAPLLDGVRRIAPTGAEDEEEDLAPALTSPLSGGGTGYRFRRGLVIHRLLQTLPGLDPAAREAAAWRFVRVSDLPEDEHAPTIAETLAVLDHPDFAPVFGIEGRAEAAVAGEVATRSGKRRVIAGRIDRLVVTSEKVLIVDYKSNRPPPKTADRVAVIYLRQMAAYRALLREIYPDRTVRCALLWTDGPRLMPLEDVLLDAHAP